MIFPIEENTTLSVIERYVAELHIHFLDYSLYGEEAPESLISELFLAERLAEILLNESE